MRATLVLAASLCALPLCSCATYYDDLNRAETHVTANEHERALALFRVNEHDVDSLNHPDHARYCYLRGMNNYRMGFRAHARYWLGLAKALEEKQHASALNEDQKRRLSEALDDLNQDYYGQGITADKEDSDADKDKDSDGKSKSSDDEPRPKKKSSD